MKAAGTKKDVFSGSVNVGPVASVQGELSVPGDKSISHRAVFLGSIAEGTTEVEGFLEGEDNISTLNAFRAMGVDAAVTGPGRVRIDGKGAAALREPSDVIDAGNSGTTARLLAGLLSSMPFFSVITGDETLRRRPMKRIVDPLVLMGARIAGREGARLLPLAIDGARLKGISYATPVPSAQLKSAVLLAGLFADGETTVTEKEKSRDHTERMLKHFGADLSVAGNTAAVRSTKALRGCKIIVPGDISSAAFFMVAATILPRSELLIRNVGVNPTRTGIIDILRKMGGSVELANAREASGEPVADIVVKSAPLKGVEITGAELLPAIDEFPALCVAAAFADGRTVISGAEELRVKESDRIAVMARSLRSVGAECEERPDGMSVRGSAGRSLDGGAVESMGDHRIAMSMAVAALRSLKGVEISGAGSVDVSFPGFFKTLSGVRA